MADWLIDIPIAHRGLHDGQRVPENSLAAFARAMEKGYPIELDVQLLADGEVVAFHDEEMSRLTGIAGDIRRQRLPDIRPLRLYGGDERIPTLREVLEFVAGATPLLIEIKNVKEVGRFEKAVRDVLTGYRGEFAVHSFNSASLAWFKHNAPSIRRGQVAGDGRAFSVWSPKRWAFAYLWLNYQSSPDFIAYDVDCLPNAQVERELRRRKLPLLTWTVTNTADEEKARRYADNIIFEGFLAEQARAEGGRKTAPDLESRERQGGLI